MKLTEVKSVKKLNRKKTVYDIEVENDHNYFANGFLVHNCITTSNVGIHYPTATLIDELRMKRTITKPGMEKPELKLSLMVESITLMTFRSAFALVPSRS